jgi:hypothetical protein
MRYVALIALVATACSGSSNSEGDSGPNSSTDAGAFNGSWVPLAASAEEFSWQGTQQRIATLSGPGVCTNANIAFAMWEKGVCYAASDGELRCAGTVGETTFGPNFANAGIQNVVQLIGSPSFTETSNAVCALKADGTAWCLGDGPDWGQFNTIDGLPPGATWTQWGQRSDIAELSAANMSIVCARHQDRSAECAGYTAPTQSLGDNVQSLWIDNQGEVHINSSDVFRVGNSDATCVVIAQGLACNGPPDLVISLENAGAPITPYGVLASTSAHGGRVVDGNAADIDSVCWLRASGKVSCVNSDFANPESMEMVFFNDYFADKRALAFALNGFSHERDLCIVRDDASIWCIGGNNAGKFGSGDMAALAIETQVQPPGSVNVNCSQ